MGDAMGGVMCVEGHHMGGVMCSWVITWVGSCMGMGPPILGRVPYVQNSLLDKVSVAGQDSLPFTPKF